jgi:hypothetical protein
VSEAIHPLRHFGVHEIFGVEVGNLAADFDFEIRDIEVDDWTNTGASGNETVPKRLRSNP